MTPEVLTAMIDNQSATISRTVRQMLELPDGRELEPALVVFAHECQGRTIGFFEELRIAGEFTLEEAAATTPYHFLSDLPAAA